MAILNGWRITRAGVVFVVGVIVLAALVFGGVWIVRERGEQARRDEAIKVAEQNLEDQSEVATQPSDESVPADSGANESQVPMTSTAPELPATGPEISHALIVTIISLAVAFYVTSRRAARQL